MVAVTICWIFHAMSLEMVVGVAAKHELHQLLLPPVAPQTVEVDGFSLSFLYCTFSKVVYMVPPLLFSQQLSEVNIEANDRPEFPQEAS